MPAWRALAALVAARGSAEGTLGSAVVQHVRLDIIFDASESLREERGNVLQLERAVVGAVEKRVREAEEDARRQVREKYEAERGHSPPEDGGVDLPEHELEIGRGWFNSKGSKKFSSEEAAKLVSALGDVSTYTGEGDLRKGLELCQDADGGDQHIDQQTNARVVAQWMRRARADQEELPGLRDDGDQHDKDPKRICIIITDDRAICDKDEKPAVPDKCMSQPDTNDVPEGDNKPCHDEEGDLGAIAKCTEIVNRFLEEGIQVVIVSKSSPYERLRLRNIGFQEFLQAVGCPKACFYLDRNSHDGEDWIDVDLIDNCCWNYVAGDNFDQVSWKVPAMIYEVVGELGVFGVFLSDGDGRDVPPPADDGPEGSDESDGGDAPPPGGGQRGGWGKSLAIALTALVFVVGGAAAWQYRGRSAPAATSRGNDMEMSGRL